MTESTMYLIALFALLLLNAFFVLAEFAAVRIRGTQVEAMLDEGRRDAKLLKNIHDHLDEYLSVCQLGITFASVGLGFVGEPAIAKLLEPLFHSSASAHGIAVTISYLFVSGMHILFGEQVPKLFAIRKSELSARWTAVPLRIFHYAFYPALWMLNTCANKVLKLLHLPVFTADTAPSEAEVKIILERSQQQGMMPFRRLLLMENVFDFGDLLVKDVMKKMDRVSVLRPDQPWEENSKIVRESRFSRYPVAEGDPAVITGVIHVKDLLLGTEWPDPVDLRKIIRPAVLTQPDCSLEQLLTDLRRRRMHLAVVGKDASQIMGIVTMEDVLEQLVGAIEDEFEQAVPLRLGDAAAETRIVLDLKAETMDQAIRELIKRSSSDPAMPPQMAVIQAVLARERSLSTYLGQGLAVPHARLENLAGPLVLFGYSHGGIRVEGPVGECAHVLFMLLTPISQPRAQVRLLARIAALRDSEYVWDRLRESKTNAEALEAIRSGDELTV